MPLLDSAVVTVSLSCGHFALSRFAHQSDLSTISTFSQNLIGHYADQDHCTHNSEIEGTGDTEEVYQISKDLQQRRADENSDNRTFAAS